MGLSHSKAAAPTTGTKTVGKIATGATPHEQTGTTTASATIPTTTPTVVVMTAPEMKAALMANNMNLMAGVTMASAPADLAALTIAQLNGATAPATNPCYSNLVDGSLTDAMVAMQYPGSTQSPKLLSPQEYQCWEFLSLHPEMFPHPSRDFTQIYKNEPYLMMV